MRLQDIDQSGGTWVYRPPLHKNTHNGHSREIYLGPKAQRAIRSFMMRREDEFLFSPREATREVREQRAAKRKTPISYGNRVGTNKKENPKRVPRDSYDVHSYRQAIHRGCKKAGIPPWSPHRLRHTAATRIRSEFGLEKARIILGHKSLQITQTYAKTDQSIAMDIVEQVG